MSLLSLVCDLRGDSDGPTLQLGSFQTTTMKTWHYLLLAIVGVNGYNDQQFFVENEPIAGYLRRFNVSGRHEAENVVSLARVRIRRRRVFSNLLTVHIGL